MTNTNFITHLGELRLGGEISASADLCMAGWGMVLDVCIRTLGIVRFEKQTDGTRRRTLPADPDVESGFKELINADATIPYFPERT